MKISKTMAFIICMSIIGVMFLALLVMQVFNKATDFPTAVFLTAVVAMGTAYLGIEVANNGVKGKHWNQQMYDAENKETIMEDRNA